MSQYFRWRCAACNSRNTCDISGTSLHFCSVCIRPAFNTEQLDNVNVDLPTTLVKEVSAPKPAGPENRKIRVGIRKR
jgi:hypothetical protein